MTLILIGIGISLMIFGFILFAIRFSNSFQNYMRARHEINTELLRIRATCPEWCKKVLEGYLTQPKE